MRGRARLQPPLVRDRFAEEGNVVAERFAEAARIDEIALHVDDDERAGARIEFELVGFCLDRRHRLLPPTVGSHETRGGRPERTKASWQGLRVAFSRALAGATSRREDTPIARPRRADRDEAATGGACAACAARA
jgi:hypothetical protein